MAIAHGATAAQILGTSVSVLLLWFLLYRLCRRSARPAWFLALSTCALYVATFLAPWMGWCALFGMFLAHRIEQRVANAGAPASGRASRNDDPRRSAPPSMSPAATRGWVDRTPKPVKVLDLDAICKNYELLLYSNRIVRAAVAALVESALVAGLVLVPWAIFDERDLAAGLLGAGVAIFLGVVALLCFQLLRALWRGSVPVAWAVLMICGAAAGASVFVAASEVARPLFLNGGIWYHAAGRGLQFVVLCAMAMGSAVVVTRRHDVRFRQILQQNAGRDWRTAVRQLCGVIVPRAPWHRALADKSLVLSALAFLIEGAAFYVYFAAGRNILKLAEPLFSPIPGPLSPIEGHYVSLVTIGCAILPLAFGSTQVTFWGAERIRRAARRASLRPAGDVLREDQRSPILFLRAFKDDQLSLGPAVLPAYARTVDPGIVQTNLEEVLQACLSLGPAVAIGRPEDITPPIGVARRYVAGEAWTDVVVSLMDAAGLIVVGVSESEGVTWEIRQLSERGHLAKSLFVIPPGHDGGLRLLCRLLGTLWPATNGQPADALLAAFYSELQGGQIAGVAAKGDSATVFLSHRPLSQVQFEVTLRLAVAFLSR